MVLPWLLLLEMPLLLPLCFLLLCLQALVETSLQLLQPHAESQEIEGHSAMSVVYPRERLKPSWKQQSHQQTTKPSDEAKPSSSIERQTISSSPVW
jgi:hypothetical protein